MKTWKKLGIALFALMMLLAACSKSTPGGESSDGGGSASGSDALRQAVEQLSGGDQPYEMTFTMTFEGMPAVEGMDMSGMSMNGTFAASPADEASSFSFIMALPEGQSAGVPGMEGGFSMDMIIIGEDAWISMPMISGLLGTDATWIHMSAADLGPDFASMSGSPFGTDPTSMLAGLEAIDEGVTEVGTETIDGVETTRYDLTMDYGALLSSGSLDEETRQQIEDAMGALGGSTDISIPMSIWVDGDGVPRQIQMTIPAGAMMGAALGEGSADASIQMTMNIVSYGEPVSIEAPPADEVAEGSDIPGFSDAFGGAATGGSGEIPEMPELPSNMPEMPEIPEIPAA